MHTVCAAMSTPRRRVDLNAGGSGSTASRRNRTNTSRRSPAHTERTVAAVSTFTPLAKASRADTCPAPSDTATAKRPASGSQAWVRVDTGAESARESADYASGVRASIRGAARGR